MTLLTGSCWAITDDPTGVAGTTWDSAWVDAVEASINALISSTTNPGVSPADAIDEIVEARGNFDTLNDRLSAIVDVDGLPATTNGRGVTQTFRGLHLRTSQLYADSLHKVELTRAREIVYNDGQSDAEEYTGINSTVLPLTADIEVAGAGGLDTGAEAGVTWYEIYIIRNDVTGTRNLLLHKAPRFVTDQNHVTNDGSHSLRRATAPVNTKLAQSFQISTTSPVEMVDVLLVRAGAVSGNIWYTIEANVGGSPSGVPLATSNVVDASLINTSNQRIRFTFRSPATLDTGVTYHLVLQGDYAASNAVNISWRADTTAATYPLGLKEFYDGVGWAGDADDDFYFTVYTTVGDSTPVLPTGYTQYCLIGYVYNDGGLEFLPFIAFDHKVVYLSETQISSGITESAPLLVDLHEILPPCLVAFNPIVISTVNGADMCVGPVPDGISAAAGFHRFMGAVRFSNPAGDNSIKIELAPVLTQYQACYLSSGAAATFDAWVGMWEWF